MGIRYLKKGARPPLGGRTPFLHPPGCRVSCSRLYHMVKYNIGRSQSHGFRWGLAACRLIKRVFNLHWGSECLFCFYPLQLSFIGSSDNALCSSLASLSSLLLLVAFPARAFSTIFCTYSAVLYWLSGFCCIIFMVCMSPYYDFTAFFLLAVERFLVCSLAIFSSSLACNLAVWSGASFKIK